MSIFKLSTGTTVQSTGTAEMGGGNLEPIPQGTKLKACITDVKWENASRDDDTQIIKARWDVLDGPYAKRVIFQKIRVNESDPKKADKHRTMLAAIDTNAGGKLQKLDRMPSDIDLQAALVNRPMLIVAGVWEMEGDKGPMSGNWVRQVEGSGAAKKAPPAPTPAAKSVPSPQPHIDDSEIPF